MGYAGGMKKRDAADNVRRPYQHQQRISQIVSFLGNAGEVGVISTLLFWRVLGLACWWFPTCCWSHGFSVEEARPSDMAQYVPELSCLTGLLSSSAIAIVTVASALGCSVGLSGAACTNDR